MHSRGLPARSGRGTSTAAPDTRGVRGLRSHVAYLSVADTVIKATLRWLGQP